MALKLTISCGPNPRLEPLMDGAVQPEGIELDFDVKWVPQLFYDNLHQDAFQVSEMSLSETLLAIDRRERWGAGMWRWSAIPVYLSRAHAWVNAHVHPDAGIHSLADLRGKRVAVPDYDMTAALWWRAALKDLHGIEAGDIEWFNMRSRGLSHGIELGLDQDPPPGVTLHWMHPDEDPIAMFERGEIDAGFSIYEGGARPADHIRPLFTDGGREVVTEYFRRTGWYQTNHHYVVQQSIIDEHPWVAMELYRALERSKQVAYERAGRASTAYVYFEGQDPDEHAAVFGEDPYPFGLQQMRPTIERLVQASLEQGLIRRPIALEEIYHPSTLDT